MMVSPSHIEDCIILACEGSFRIFADSTASHGDAHTYSGRCLKG